MQRTLLLFAIRAIRLTGARNASKSVRAITLACATGFSAITTPAAAFAAPHVAFDVATTAECRDVTPPQRIVQYPNQRLIEVTLPVSVRFHEASMDDVDELSIEVSGAPSRLRVYDFAPATQLASDIADKIETTTTTKKSRSLDGTLGGSLPIPGADVAAHLTPSITADLSNCDTATEKINRLPPKHAVVVSGTSSAGQSVFFKLKRYSQTSLEGVHELTITFIAPRAWKWAEIRVDCAARGERKVLWMKQSDTIGQSSRMVQLVEMSARPVRQTVLKPVDPAPTAAKVEPKPEPKTDKPVPVTANEWRAALHEAISAEMTAQLTDDAIAKNKKTTAAARTSSSAE